MCRLIRYIIVVTLMVSLTACGRKREQLIASETVERDTETAIPESSDDTVASAVADPVNQQVLYLWDEGNMPSVTEYTQNNGRYADDPDFRPYMVTFPVQEETTGWASQVRTWYTVLYQGGSLVFTQLSDNNQARI